MQNMNQNNVIPKMNYTRQEAAQALGISTVTLDAFIHRATDPLPIFKAGSRKVLIPVAELEAWVKRETERHTYGRA